MYRDVGRDKRWKPDDTAQGASAVVAATRVKAKVTLDRTGWVTVTASPPWSHAPMPAAPFGTPA